MSEFFLSPIRNVRPRLPLTPLILITRMAETAPQWFTEPVAIHGGPLGELYLVATMAVRCPNGSIVEVEVEP